ncbi:MAG: hypothetical protein RDV48_24115 [Candidatus Eremiobacteraeota bacterium]|nr:hypothetical protein [Candidatus Eremiobacteraeota bacterium]
MNMKQVYFSRLSIFLLLFSFLAFPPAVPNELPPDASTEKLLLNKELHRIIFSEKLPEDLKISYKYNGGGPPGEAVIEDGLNINGNGIVWYNTTSFCEKNGYWDHPRYKYLITREEILEILRELAKNEFITRTFEEEINNVPNDCAFRSFRLSINGKSVEKTFLEKTHSKEDIRFLSSSEYLKQYIGKGLPKELERLQFLIDNVIRKRHKIQQ